MYARVTLLEIDALRSSIPEALETFRTSTMTRLSAQPGYRGVWVLANPEGKGLLMSLWDTEEQAAIEGDHGYYEGELGRFATLFRSPPGRDRYEVVFVDEPVRTG